MNIYLYGNCQARALSAMILEDHPEWNVSFFELYNERAVTGHDVAQHHMAVRNANVVIAQPVGAFQGNEDMSIAALKESLAGRGALVTFPSMVFKGTHGAFDYLHHHMSGLFMPYHNCHAIDMHVRNYHWDHVCKLQLAPDFYPPGFVAGGIAASLAELRYREDIHATTIKVSREIDEHCRSIVLMNTINHPNRFLMARVLNAVYRALSLQPVARDTGPDLLREPFLPPLPTVLAHLGLRDDQPEVQVGGRRWTREAYLRESLAFYASIIPAELKRAFAETPGANFLQALHGSPKPLAEIGAGLVASPGGSSDAIVHSMIAGAFQTFLKRRPSPAEIDAHSAALVANGVETWLGFIADSEEFALVNRSA